MTHETGGAHPANRLKNSTSPYLLQHAHNPVDWYPWGPEALERARREDRPIFLSIGYAACHWCHVMEHESFENPEIAALMNDNFVCIKVDREERPDLDEIYMSAVQLMTGSGGWPMTVFLTPDLKPFYGGTYFPPDDRYQHPGLRRLLPEVARLYHERRGDVTQQAAELSTAVGRIAAGGGGTPAALNASLIDSAAVQLLTNFDSQWGGFGGAPKFPPSMGLSLLLRYRHTSGDASVEPAARLTLERMALGGMYDALGGGFARYSVDDRWQVPHFEKMLYDNALLVSVYSEALLALGDDRGLYARTINETLDFVERELSDPAGGFYSSLDADSEGEEGKFYVWTADEIRAALGADAEFFMEVYDVTWDGNWEHGNSVLWVTPDKVASAATAEPRLAPLRAKLLAARNERIRPALDDKVLVAWNGLMVSAFCRAAQALDDPRRAERAVRAADFILKEMRRNGRLLRSWRRGTAGLMAYNEDYAFLIDGLVDLYETTFAPRWLAAASELADMAILHYRDPAEGGFFLTADDAEDLLHRPRSGYDGATPSGNSVMAGALLRLAVLLDRADYRAEAERTLNAFSGRLRQVPAGHLRMLAALDELVHPAAEIAVVGPAEAPATKALLETAWTTYLPSRVIAWRAGGDAGGKAAPAMPLLEGKGLVDGAPAAYVCRNYACAAPVTTPAALRSGLGIPSPRK